MPSVGTFPRDLDILANVMTFFRIKSVISSPSGYYFFAVDFFQERYILVLLHIVYFHFYRKVLEVH